MNYREMLTKEAKQQLKDQKANEERELREAREMEETRYHDMCARVSKVSALTAPAASGARLLETHHRSSTFVWWPASNCTHSGLSPLCPSNIGKRSRARDGDLEGARRPQLPASTSQLTACDSHGGWHGRLAGVLCPPLQSRAPP